MEVLYLGRALHTKETLLDFLKWRRVTRHPFVFRRLMGSQRTPGKWGITFCLCLLLFFVSVYYIRIKKFKKFKILRNYDYILIFIYFQW